GSILVSALFAWLTFVNVLLGLFNLVPAFPLDGGRLLSSLLWWRSGSRQSGVHNAVRVGRVFAYLMIAAGVLELFLGSVASGIWWAFLGWSSCRRQVPGWPARPSAASWDPIASMRR